MTELRALGDPDREALRAYLLRDACRNAYLLSIVHWFGVAGPRARVTGAFEGGRLVGTVAEGREVHCWYASLAADEPRVARALAPVLVPARVSVLLGDEPLVSALLDALPAARRCGVTRMLFAASSGDPYAQPEHPVRRADAADLETLVDLYEGYETDGYPTRRHLRRALAERLRWAAIFVHERDGRPVVAMRVDASSPEVWLVGGLTTHPDYRGHGYGRSVRLAAMNVARDARIRTCGLRDPRNPLHRNSSNPTIGTWLIAALRVPAPSPGRRLLNRVRARLSRWDRPCVRREMTYLPEGASLASAPRAEEMLPG